MFKEDRETQSLRLSFFSSPATTSPRSRKSVLVDRPVVAAKCTNQRPRALKIDNSGSCSNLPPFDL